MNSDIADSPPPAYSEQDYDRKFSTCSQLPLTISEEPEGESGQEEWDEADLAEQAASSNTSSRSASRALPSLPQSTRSTETVTRGLRIHKKSSSHSFGSSESLAKSRPSWLADGGSKKSGHVLYQGTEETLLSPRPSSPPQFLSQSDLSHRRRRALPAQPHNTSSPMNAALLPANHPPVPRLDFNPAVAYTRSEVPSMTTDARQPALEFDASAFYNSAVSSHLKSSNPRLRPRHQASRSISTPLSPNYPNTSASRGTYTSPPTSPVPTYSAQPFSEDFPSGTTQFPGYPSPSYNAPASASASSNRWATSEHQFSRF